MKNLFLLISMFLLLAAQTNFAQIVPSDGTTLKRIQRLNSLSSKGKITAYYSSGYESRVEEVRPLLEKMSKFYERKLRVKPQIGLAILTKEDWKRYAGDYPYGIPSASPDSPHIVLLPATRDNVITSGILQNGEKPFSAGQLKELKANKIDFEQAAIKFVDLIGFHEVGHTFSDEYGISYQSRWLSEFMASYFAYAFMREKQPKLAVIFKIINSGAQPIVKYTSLADFERLYFGVGVDNYGWYQGKFAQKAVEVYNRKGVSFIIEVQKAFPNSEKSAISLQETLARLEKIDVGFTEWAKNLK